MENYEGNRHRHRYKTERLLKHKNELTETVNGSKNHKNGMGE